ncbi:hypothetical protein ACFQZ1_09110 [Bacillus sp. CGMCC 1.60114]|uniref:hypothetical protein n=1 Tax=unclassified Bacillus (in: firmicutes) TaxID=185979 RepID=UPI00362DB0E2
MKKVKKLVVGIACFSVLSTSFLTFSPSTYAAEQERKNDLNSNCSCTASNINKENLINPNIIVTDDSNSTKLEENEVSNFKKLDKVSEQLAVGAKLAKTSFPQDYKMDGKNLINYDLIDVNKYGLDENEKAIFKEFINDYNISVAVGKLQSAYTSDASWSGFTVYIRKADLQNMNSMIMSGLGCAIGGILGLPSGVGSVVGCVVGGIVGGIASTFVNEGINSGVKVRFNWAGQLQWTQRWNG